MRETNQRERNYFNERATLGAVVLNNEAFSDVAHIVGTSAEMFTEAFHKDVWSAMVRLSAERKPIDYVTLTDLCQA